MGLTLPGVLGRIFTAATDIWQSAKLASQTFPNTMQFGDGRLYISDGTEDLTSGSLVYMLPDLYLRTKPGRLGIVIRGNADSSIENIFEIQDHLTFPIFWIKNAGGLGLNDNFAMMYNPLVGAPNVYADIYGHFQLGRQSCLRFNAGPPGNILRFTDATGELFNRQRSNQQGTWTAVNAAYSGANYSSVSEAPTGYQWVRQWTASAAGNIVTTTATGTSGYPIGSGQWVAAVAYVKSVTTARSKQLALLFYNSAGTQIGSATGTAVTDNTTGWTRLDVQGVSAAGTTSVALQLTVTGAAASGEQHQDTMAGIWQGLQTNDITAWNPPFVYRTDAFGGVNAAGDNDGANVGDVIVRNDGPGNVVQRFWTCVKAGRPWEQKWSSDPRLTSQPAKLNWYGGTYLLQGASANADYVLPNVAGGLLHNDPLDTVNRAVTSARLLDDSSLGSNPLFTGGISAFVQSVRKKNTGQPYVAKDGVFVFWWGPWDLGYVTASQGSGVMGHLTGYSATPGGTGSAFINTLRYVIRHARASVILPHTNAAFVHSGGAASGAVPYAYTGGGPGVSGNFRNYSTVGNSFTFTIPADFEGGAVSFGLIGAEGSFGGTITWSGTAPGATGTTVLSNVSDFPFRNKVVKSFTGLTAANAGQTIIGTVSALDAGGAVGLDCAFIEGSQPNLVFVCGSPRLRDNTAYVTLGNTMIGSSYWAGNSGTTGDSDITTLNASILSLCGEFTDSLVQYVDMDGAIQKFANYYYVGDGVRMDESGVHVMAQQFADTLNAALPPLDFRSVNHDYHDTTVVPVGSPWTKQGMIYPLISTSRLYVTDYWELMYVHAGVNTAPAGASIIVDILKNGSTIFTTTANRATIAAAANTGQSAKPDMYYLAPGDYLQVQIVQVGTTNPGDTLTVQVFGRKVPIP